MNTPWLNSPRPRDFVEGAAGYVPVPPAQKAAEAEALRRQIRAFVAAGNAIIVLPPCRPH